MSDFPPQPAELNEDDFYEKYKPKNTAEDESILWERSQILPFIKDGSLTDNNVWSVVDAEDDAGALAGWHIVNVFAYMVTEVPWTDGRESMMFDALDGEDV